MWFRVVWSSGIGAKSGKIVVKSRKMHFFTKKIAKNFAD